MKTQKITPKDRQLIVARVKAGEKQKDLADEFGVSAGLISRVVRQSRAANGKPEPKPTRFKDLSSSHYRATPEPGIIKCGRSLKSTIKNFYANWGNGRSGRGSVSRNIRKPLIVLPILCSVRGWSETIMGLRSQLSYLEECQKRGCVSVNPTSRAGFASPGVIQTAGGNAPLSASDLIGRRMPLDKENKSVS